MFLYVSAKCDRYFTRNIATRRDANFTQSVIRGSGKSLCRYQQPTDKRRQ
jgi:hypothetical protein